MALVAFLKSALNHHFLTLEERDTASDCTINTELQGKAVLPNLVIINNYALVVGQWSTFLSTLLWNSYHLQYNFEDLCKSSQILSKDSSPVDVKESVAF